MNEVGYHAFFFNMFTRGEFFGVSEQEPTSLSCFLLLAHKKISLIKLTLRVLIGLIPRVNGKVVLFLLTCGGAAGAGQLIH